MGVTPETAQQCKVQLSHLRWHAGKMAPRKYGPLRAMEAEGRQHDALHVYTKKFVTGPGKARPGALERTEPGGSTSIPHGPV